MAKNNGKNILFLLICVLVLAIALGGFGCNQKLAAKSAAKRSFSCAQNVSVDIQRQTTTGSKNMSKKDTSCKIELLCIMYHNVVADNQKQGDYEMRVSAVERDFVDLKEKCYKCVSQKKLVEVVDKQRYGKYVMITFDDGFFGVYKHIPPLLEKYDMSCVVAVTGEFIDMADKQDYKTRCSYMNTAEVKKLAENPRVEIAHHSYNFHHITKARRGVRINNNENINVYNRKFFEDTKKLESKLCDFGVKPKTYCYPFGEYCTESEKALKNMGYQMTMTCNEHINYLSNRDSLFLLGRLNRSAKYQNISEMLLKAGCKN